MRFGLGIVTGVAMFLVGMGGPVMGMRNSSLVLEGGSLLSWLIAIIAIICAGAGLENKGTGFLTGTTVGVLVSMLLLAFGMLAFFLLFPALGLIYEFLIAQR